jgi:hypothetical protein
MLDNKNISKNIQTAQTNTRSKPPPSILRAKSNLRVSDDSHTRLNQLSTLSKMRWFLLIGMGIWILVALSITGAAFCFTRSPYSFSLFTTLAPPVYLLIRITKYLFPRDDKDFRLAAMKIQRRKYNTTHLPFDIDTP